MFAGHMLITIAAVGTLYLWGTGTPINYVLGLLPFIGSLGLVFFELLICSLQAYVFVLLTAIYLESSLGRLALTGTPQDPPAQEPPHDRSTDPTSSTSTATDPHHLARTGAASD